MTESQERTASSPPPAGPVAMLPAITRLTAPEPGWVAEADVVIVGSGIAGLTAALRIAARGDLRVMVVTKDVLSSGSTRWAQGGIAAALGVDDTTDEHLADTLVAGVGLCEVDAVRVLVDEGPAAVRDLVELGARFDQTVSTAGSRSRARAVITAIALRTPAATRRVKRSSGRWVDGRVLDAAGDRCRSSTRCCST